VARSDERGFWRYGGIEAGKAARQLSS